MEHLIQFGRYLLNLDQIYGAPVTTLRAIMWGLIALFLWYVIYKFIRMPGNGGKYLWQMLLIPMACTTTTLAIVEYCKGQSFLVAEVLFVPGAAFLVCLVLVTIRLQRPRYRSHFATSDVVEMAQITAQAAKDTALATKAAASAATVTAAQAEKVAEVAQEAADEVVRVATIAATAVLAEAVKRAAEVNSTALEVARRTKMKAVEVAEEVIEETKNDENI